MVFWGGGEPKKFQDGSKNLFFHSKRKKIGETTIALKKS